MDSGYERNNRKQIGGEVSMLNDKAKPLIGKFYFLLVHKLSAQLATGTHVCTSFVGGTHCKRPMKSGIPHFTYCTIKYRSKFLY